MDDDLKPEVLMLGGQECARWGQGSVRLEDPQDPVPWVYSCESDIEIGGDRLSFAEAEALATRIGQALAYERHRGQERLANLSSDALDRLSLIAAADFGRYYADRWTDLLPAALDAVHDLALELNRRWAR